MNDHTITEAGVPRGHMYALQDLTALLVRHLGYSEGIFDLAFTMNVAIGLVGTNPDQMLPGGMFGISGIGVQQVPNPTKTSVDAAVVNPRN